MATRALVTGGAGFIGSHVVDELVGRGFEVRVVDLLHPAAHAESPGYLNPGAEYVFEDLRDPAVAHAVVRGVDVVSHQASMVGMGRDFGDAGDYVSHNDLATAVLLGALGAAGFRGPLVLGSSMAVYGEGRWRCAWDGNVRPGPRSPALLEAGRFDPPCPACGGDLQPEAVDEDAPPDPRSVYAATKLHQEHLCFAFSRETGAAVTALRYHNVYGPRMPRDTPYAGVASIFRSSLEGGRPAELFEDGRQLRDFVHVRDVAWANVLALTAGRPVSGVFNVATGEPRSVADMARALTAAFGGTAGPPVVTGRYRAGDVRHVFGSPARAAAALGFEPRISFDRGMAEFARAPLRRPVLDPARRAG
jgi:dTDP-L-rhamnose 4-epimerase